LQKKEIVLVETSSNLYYLIIVNINLVGLKRKSTLT